MVNVTNYKYYISLTSQLPFCSTPLRLDASNKCEFGCAYCFASTRQGFGRNSKLQLTNTTSLDNRLKRVEQNKLAGAIDEFLQRRIPIQFGGMSDPLSRSPVTQGVTQTLLKTLAKYNYPVVLSTKSALIAEPEFLAILSSSNCYVRFSTTVVDHAIRTKIDSGASSFRDICEAAEKLSKQNIPVCFRFQPIIPGHEHFAPSMIENASNAGVKHISAEYLKAPIDADQKFRRCLKDLLHPRPIEFFKNLGSNKLGREFILPLQYRLPSLLNMKQQCGRYGITFGFADNDLLMYSDGNSCCSAADLYLRDAAFFRANIVAIAKKTPLGGEIELSDLISEWSPSLPISSYINSKARINPELIAHEDEWHAYLTEMWAGRNGVYSPDFFFGISRTAKTDQLGLPIYRRSKTELDSAPIAKESSLAAPKVPLTA